MAVHTGHHHEEICARLFVVPKQQARPCQETSQKLSAAQVRYLGVCLLKLARPRPQPRPATLSARHGVFASASKMSNHPAMALSTCSCGLMDKAPPS